MSSKQERPRRSLTEGESFVLKQILEMYGERNTEDDVFFSDIGEAVLFVKDRNGIQVLMAVLTNLAAMCEDGTIGSL
jgi:hypothetical protein